MGPILWDVSYFYAYIHFFLEIHHVVRCGAICGRGIRSHGSEAEGRVWTGLYCTPNADITPSPSSHTS
ncbi:MAG: hypothetical protein PHS47_06045, partial [Methanocellales archaeon]|nr:hypothetical protein [Methanocellales archaeon]